jgi:hypothetical protein
VRNPTLHDSAKPLSWYSCSGLDGLLWVGVVGDKPTKRGGGGCLVYRVYIVDGVLLSSTFYTWVEPSAVPSWPACRCESRRAWAAADCCCLYRNGRDRVMSARRRCELGMPSSTPSRAVSADRRGPLDWSGPAPLARRGGRQPGRPGGRPGTADPQEPVPCDL